MFRDSVKRLGLVNDVLAQVVTLAASLTPSGEGRLNRKDKLLEREKSARAVIFHHFTLTQYCKLSCESEMPRYDTTQKKITLALTQNDIVQ